jgi:signal-transduction protein with cAMP-binding, CBS, and nucleotidyltransferase domain
MSTHERFTVRDVMSESPQVIDGLATVREAIERMRDHGVSSVVVDRRDDHDEYGIVVIHDIAEHVVSANRSPDRTSVYEVMSKPVITLDAEMDIKYAVRLLYRFGLSRAIVVEDGALVGLVTLRDLVLRYVDATART